MKIEMDLRSDRRVMWELKMEYHDLPPEYAQEIAAAAENLKSYIAHLRGNAREVMGVAAQAPPRAYQMRFSFKAEHAPEGAPGRWSGEAEATDLLYSQALDCQEAGAELLKRLIESGRLEVASGQRQ